ncbi:hypothetical protein ACHAW5_000471 [Stephanodiscus triporus]|uniref:Ricin B lectin domain-containing protein n=1 Tax=Stephanodiscus triporus TaxID=2934178 RepID=A0ABD3NBS2_9STRA
MKLRLLFGSAAALMALAVSSEDADTKKNIKISPDLHSAFTRRMNGGRAGKETISKSASKPTHKLSTAKAANATPDSTGSKVGKKILNTKSGKGSKAVEYDLYYMAPSVCQDTCIDAYDENIGTGDLDIALTSCSTRAMGSRTQQWILRMSNDIVQVESSAYLGECIAVSLEYSCSGDLQLMPCDNPGALWYFTGGQLISLLCWSRGVSAAMGVSYKADASTCDKLMVYEVNIATDASSRATGTTNSVSTAQATFMLITIDDMNKILEPLSDDGSP